MTRIYGKNNEQNHRKNNFAAGMAVGAAAAIMGCSLAGIYFSRHYRYSSLATAYSSRGTKTATSSTVESQNQEAITDELMNSAYRFKRGWQFKNSLP